jgi:hypothetical protein
MEGNHQYQKIELHTDANISRLTGKLSDMDLHETKRVPEEPMPNYHANTTPCRTCFAIITSI